MATNYSSSNKKKDHREEDLRAIYSPQKVPFKTPGTDARLEADLMDIYRDPLYVQRLDDMREGVNKQYADYIDRRNEATATYRDALKQQALQAGGGTAMETYQNTFKNNNVTVTPNSFGSYWDKYQNAINSGAFDEGDDYTKWSPKKVNDRIKELQEEIANITKLQTEATKEEKEEKKLELEGLWRQKGAYTALDMGDAGLWNRNLGGEVKNRPADYATDDTIRAEYDRTLYDQIHGDGSYEQRVESLKTDADVDRFDREMDDLWNRFENRTLYQIPEQDTKLQQQEKELNNFFFGTEEQEKELKRLQKWQENRENIGKYEAGAAGLTVPEDWKAPEQNYLTGGNNRGQQLLNIMTGPQGEKKVDKIWREMSQERSAWGRLTFEEQNNVLQALGRGESIDLSGGGADDLFGAVGRHYIYMTDDQVATFENYYKNGMEDEALAYMDALEQYYLQPAQTMYQQMVARQEAEGPNGWMYGATSILTRPFDSMMGMIGTGLALAGNEDAASANSGWYRGQAINDAIRGGRTEAWGQTAEDLLGEWARKPAEFLNGVFYSMADMTMAAATGQTAAGAGTQGANILTQFIMSSEAASSTMREQLEQHRDPTEAALRSIGAGAIEWITEKYSIEQLLNPNVKEMLRSKKGLASFIAKNTIAEGSEEGASDVLNIALDVLLSGVYGHEDEITAAYNNYRKQGMTDDEATRAVLWDNLSQIGLDMLAGSVSGFLMSGSRVGMNAVGMKSEGRNIKSGSNTTAEGVTGIDQVLQLSLGMKEGTQSRALAEEIQKKIDSGKTPTDFEMGRLAQLTAVEAGEQQEALVRDNVERTIRESITKQGVPAQEAAQYSAIITGSLMEGKSLTKEQMSVLSQSEPAMNVWKSYNTRTGATALGMEARKAAAPSQSIINRLGDLTGQTNYGNSVIAAEIVRSSRETNSPAEAIDNLAQRRSDLMSEDFAKVAKEVLQSDKKIVNKARFLDDAMKIRLAAMTLNDNMPANGMSAESAQKLYDAARAEFDAIDEQRIRQQVQVKPGEGWAKFNGAEYGTAAFDEAIAGQNRQLRNQMRMIGEVATRMGSRVTFINDEDNPGIFGYEQSDGSITINIAGKHRSGLSHHMMVTLSHEMTHWLEQNSREGYNQLRKFVLDSLRAKGTNIEQLIVSSIDNQNAVLGADSGESLTINGAMAEIVARSCENLLSSQAMADELAKTNPSLYAKVKSFVKNFVARMREAVKGMNSSLSYEARALMKETEKIAKIWLGAREEALGRTDIAEAMDNGDLSEVLTSYSMDQLDNGYMDAVKSGDVEAAAQYVEEYAKRKGYTDRAYHGTLKFGFTEFDMTRSQDEIFVGFDRGVADTYTLTNEVKNIAERDATDYSKWNADDLVKKALDKLGGKIFGKEITGVEHFEGQEAIDYVGEPDLPDWYRNELRRGLFVMSLEGDDFRIYTRDQFEGVLTGGTYQLFMKPGKQLVVDAGGNMWNNIKVPWDTSKTYKTRDIADYARKNGYDSVRINQVRDNAGLGNTEAESVGDIGVFFNQTDVKSADPVTYDDQGEVIPLSERFTDEQKDIRYSIEQLPDGTKFVNVDTDQEQFNKLSPSEMLKKAKYIILDRFAKEGDNKYKLPDKTGKVTVNSKTANEYAFPSKRDLTTSQKRAKGKASTELDNLIAVSKRLRPGDPLYPNPSVGHAAKNMKYYSTLFRINGVYFTGVLNVENKPTGQYLKDLTQIKKDTSRNGSANIANPGQNTTVHPASVNNNYTQNKTNGKIYSMEQLDAEYQEAVERGDLQRATDMLMDRLAETEGIIPFNAPHGYGGQHKDIAKLIKEGTPEAVARAAADMARFVPENGVLIPMPPHEGTVNADTDTMILANAIGKLTGRPVVVALESDPRESRYKAKSEGRKGVSAAEMGFRQVEEIPEGSMPIFVDNVVGSGVTADAARTAMGGGITLAYAKGTQSKGIEGLKRATVTYDRNGKLIPLSQRFDRSIRNVNYSTEQRDDAYQKAIDSGDVETQQRMVDEAAEKAFANSKVRGKDGKLLKMYHGTKADFNEFKREYIGSTGRFEGSGFNFTPAEGRAKSYGGNVLAGYLNIQKPLSAEKKTITVAKLAAIIRNADPTGDNIISDYARETRDYGSASFVRREALTAARNIWESSDNDVDIYSFISAADSDAEGLIAEFEKLGYDGLIHYNDDGNIKTAVAFSSNQFKRADPVTYGDDKQPIKLSERFNTEKQDIRYSVDQEDEAGEIRNDGGEVMAQELSGGSYTMYSLESWENDDIDALVKQLVERGFKKKDVQKWVDDVNGIAAIIASNRDRYDYIKAPNSRMLKNNQEYVKTLDASTLCAKRLLYQGIFNEIQHLLPNTPLLPEDLINLVNMMKEDGKVTPCAICYVESRRRMLGKYADEWLKGYKGEYVPRLEEVTTTDGLENLRKTHPDTYQDFVDAMNAKGSANPKVVQLRTDYKSGEIRGMTEGQIEKVKSIGGLRVQSFSDFEVVHMIDMMQAVMDMAAMGLTSQAYTKVPEFAWVFGDTGMKINLSLIGEGTGLDENGNLVFSDTEGMPFEKAMELRNRYSKNVGTILVGMNDDHIIAAMGDDRIDFIIPFHKSGWSKRELARVHGMSVYKDYTRTQNEKLIAGRKPNGKGYITIPNKKSKISNLAPVGPEGYWDFSKSGQWNAEKYLKLCAEQKRMPKFPQFLVDNGDGSFSLPEGTDKRSTAIRTGYWKTLIDFKMYDNQGKGSPQTNVKPTFNMEAARNIMESYDGNPNELPTDHKIAQAFAENYKKEHPGRRQYSMEDAPDMDVNAWMAGLTPGSLQTEDERALLQAWKDLRMKISMSIKRQLDYKAKIKRLESIADPTPQEREDLVAVRNKLKVQEERQARLERDMAKVTSQEGFAGMMYQQNMVMKDFITGRTQDEVNNTVDDMVHEVQKMAQEIATAKRELEKIAAEEGVKQAEAFLKKTQLGEYAKGLKKDYHSRMTEGEIRSRMAEMALRIAQGETVEDILDSASELAYDLARTQNGYQGAYGEAADRLKQVTIVIGQTQYEQLRAQHSSIPELRRQLAGTGVKIVYDKNLRGAGTLEDIGPGSEIHNLLPELGEDTGNMMDNLDKFLSVARGIRDNLESEMVHDFDIQDATDMIRGFAMLGAAEMKGNPAMATQIRRLLGLQKADSGKAGELAERLANAQDYMRSAMEKGEQAKGLTKMLKKDVDSAINYYNKTAAVAAKEEKRKVREDLIKQLKSEHGQALLKEQMKWRDLIEKDKTVREKMASNHKLRQWITTDYSRIRKLLINETDQKNIPEHMKSLARQMLKMLTENDMIGRKITEVERADLKETLRVLGAMKETDAEFTPNDLKAINDEEVQAAVADALADLEDGIKFYNASPGSDRISNLQAFHNALDRIHGAVDTIYSVIKAQQSISFMDRQILVADAAEDIRRDMEKSRFKGELKGRGSKAIRTAKNAVVYGNMTPVYFIKNLLNRGMDEQWKEIERGENQYGLEEKKAETYVADLAERTGYSNWSNQKLKVTLGGNTKTISIENAMELYAIWRREQTTNPEMSQHLTKGGVVINEEEETGGKLQREHKEMRPIRVTDGEIMAMYDQLTDEQKAYIEGMVKYLSNDMSELGNAASMRMYGIKKYKEKYYFPMKVWDGVKSARSDKGISGTDENRAAHKSWSKRRQNMARNALVIGNFTQDAVNHIVEMITYNTMAPAIENLNRVLNFQFTEGMTEDDITKRSLRIMFAENYGKDALKYLETFMADLNGGTVQDQRKTLRDRMLAIFKKNAVAGSLSVALQQPLSYVRAAMMINPKYLAQALNPKYWKGSHEEMTKYSGVAVIKDMGRFDMNFGQSAADSIMPEGAKTKGRAAYEWLSDKTTMLPEMMDRMTWTRMWSAVKAEQAAQNPGMDVKSDEFLQKCAERFNDVMRKTQVYDSVLVKSSNMRSQNLATKVITSFMAEPTLTLNVLADAVRNVNLPGGKAVLAKAGATYVLSAVFQALVKAAMGTGRSPDKKKTVEENILNKFMQSFMGEVNPMSLIPGYSDIIEVLKTGELKDDAMGALGKLFSVVETTQKAIQGKGSGAYRDIEDTVGQLAQLFTNIPAKNLMRDARAMWNWAVVRPYADRATSGAVLKEQSMANFMTGDNLLGVLNKWLGDAGYKTTNAAYYDRMMQAREAGDAEREDELHEYLTLARGVTDKTISQEMRKRMKASSVLTPEEKIKQLREDGMKDTDIAGWIVDEYEAGNLTKTEAEKLYVQANPKKDANDAYFMFERKEQEKETGESVTGGDYYKLDAAIAKGDTAAATAAAKDLTAHGYTSEDVNDHAKDYITKKYRAREITNAQAKQALKTFRKDLDDVEIFWMLDRIDYKNETGKSAGSGKYYRLDAAIEANKAAEITRAVNDMMKYGGYDKEGVLKGIRYFKKTYLAAEGNEKIKLRDALTKAFKAAGMSATEATKEIDSWKPAKTKKKKGK